jgi:hypothetical protein
LLIKWSWRRRRKELERLLLEEKRQMGLSGNDLCYIGMADTAGWWWCAKKSVITNREMELAFFTAHLLDRITYSLKLGYIDASTFRRSICGRLGEGLPTLPQLTRADVERILEIKSRPGRPKITIDEEAAREIADAWDGSEAEKEGVRLQLTKAEDYPSVRWAFRWRDFMVQGVPDGITKEFVYEFKTTRGQFLLHFLRPVAFTQGDLYGYFFERPRKRIQILIRDTGEIKTWEEPVDKTQAEETLNSLWNAVRRGSPAPAPKQWKCRSCEYAGRCVP